MFRCVTRGESRSVRFPSSPPLAVTAGHFVPAFVFSFVLQFSLYTSQCRGCQLRGRSGAEVGDGEEEEANGCLLSVLAKRYH